jgi:hypothetical protein
VRLIPALAISAVSVVALVLAGCAGTGSGFPASVYPPPASFPKWGGQSGCPSLDGVEAPGTPASDTFRSTVDGFGENLAADLRAADRALWPDLVSEPVWGSRPSPKQTLSGAPAKAAPYADLIANSCGQQTLTRSWWIQTCPGPAVVDCARSPALVGHWFFINRRGHWLLWFTYP